MPQIRQTPSKSNSTAHFSWVEFSLLLLFCVAIAGFLNLVRGDGFVYNLLFSEAIGISIYSSIKALIRLRHSSKADFTNYLIGIPLGGVIGVIIGALLTRTDPRMLFSAEFGAAQEELLIPMVAAIVFGVAISWFFHSRDKLATQRLALEEEARRRSEREKSLMATQLQLLQAQIEPHFLFNALANVISLIDNSPDSARKMLEHLSDYLRTSLQRTRTEQTTVQDEVDLLTAYLSVQQIRMGERLRFDVDCPASLLNVPLPALLVQPLVENAIKHGLEDAPDGGSVTIRFQRHDDALLISVTDDGAGIQQNASDGVGLENIRERLALLYDETARLTLRENPTSGVKAEISLPLDDSIAGARP